MDAEALATFLAVHRQRGFSNAARFLHRTQPAISRRIALLEQELGVKLFERAAGAIALSQAGRTLLPHAERALASLRDAEDAIRALATGNAGPLTMAIVGTLAGTDLTGVLRRFARDHPAVELVLQTARSGEVSDLVRRGEVTIGLRYDRDRSGDLEAESLGSEKLLVVCAAAHRLAGRMIGSLAALRDERWIGFPRASQPPALPGSHIVSVFAARGLGELDWMAIDSLTAQKRLVEAGFGVALIPASSAEEELAAGTLATIGVRGLDVGTPVFIVTRKGGYLSAAAVRLLALLRTQYTAGWRRAPPTRYTRAKGRTR
ncbi:MAG: LysR family transcriptional regulator [Alphaproteobacteria bacterium]|nr:LysR family transcriptional regulator [Alphaproteobacteria bacterium]MCW5738908.1 LysR family transcriptional regulator [Alphaproteobacteria bacterium]